MVGVYKRMFQRYQYPKPKNKKEIGELKMSKFKSERQAPKFLLTKREFNLDNRSMRIILNHIEINHAIQNKMRIHRNNKVTMGIYVKKFN